MEQPCLSSGNNRISEATSPVSYGLIMLPEKFRTAIYNQIRDNMQWKILWKRIFHDNFVQD